MKLDYKLNYTGHMDQIIMTLVKKTNSGEFKWSINKGDISLRLTNKEGKQILVVICLDDNWEYKQTKKNGDVYFEPEFEIQFFKRPNEKTDKSETESGFRIGFRTLECERYREPIEMIYNEVYLRNAIGDDFNHELSNTVLWFFND